MAHLKPGDEAPDDAGGRDRAQLLLLAGFVLAAIFVAFAFLLNAVIFAENLATRGEGSRTTHAVTTADDVAAGTEGVIVYANEHNTTDNSTLEAELKSGIADVERLAGTQQLADGGVLRVEYDSHRSGTWINQSYRERNFTDDSYTSDWELFSGADGARAFRIDVTDPDQLQDLSGPTPIRNFTVVAHDAASPKTWEMRVYHDDADVVSDVTGSAYVAEVTDGDGDTGYCSLDDSLGPSSFWINVSAGTFAGEECRALRFGEGLSTIEKVEYNNGDNINGTYRLMAAKGKGAISPGSYNDTGREPPVRTTAIYNATVHVTYDSGDLYYETDRTAEPGRDDE